MIHRITEDQYGALSRFTRLYPVAEASNKESAITAFRWLGVSEYVAHKTWGYTETPYGHRKHFALYLLDNDIGIPRNSSDQ